MTMSVWWAVAAFLAGGWAGMIALALMVMASREHEVRVSAEEALVRDGVGPVKLEPTWTTK